ncbi:hypothetical protein B0T20DRAFT_96545 [Sordaria brevicollis]|uniref:U4/U6 snRNA-associated-splicing factor PRP24 n=1 Tax=Sordaria brevicollis TaxID=83679 RepID=A0AAE0U2F1_SORBR|nr:hypothetical protein B0T20DRAFT_96545 [Sordaria brevicollis]
MASPVGEDNWVDFVDHQLRGATDLESRVKVIETFRRAVQAEPGSLKVWMAYCEYFWSLYSDCQPGSDAGWPIEEQHVGRETFTLDHALNLWQEGYEAVQYRLSDSHQLWNRWVSLEMELLARTATEAGVRRITHLYKNRLAVPHAAWDNTSQMFSSFLSEYNRANYESEMLHVTANAREAKRLYELRDPWEMKLNQAQKAGDIQGMKAIMTEYIDWEIRQAKNKKDNNTLTNIRICLGLFSRALTGIMSSHEETWLNFLVFVSTWHSDIKMNRVKLPNVILPNMLDVLQRAVHHVPWCGTVWARYILAAEEAGLGFTDIERIKHAATSCAQLDRDGMGGVLEMYSAWCGYLKRTAMNPNATEEAVDLAEVGLPSALEDVRHWGKRRYGDAYQGDPNFRLEKILIQFLTEKKDDINEARAVWEQLSVIPLHANSYDFWLAWFLWEMLVFASTKSKNRSPTPATLAQGLRVPSFATRVFIKALKVRTLDWPERIMDVYLQHCNDYELAETLREAQDTIYKTRKGVAKRREREAVQAQAAAQAQAQAAYEAQAQTQPPALAQHQPQQYQQQVPYQQYPPQDHPMTDAQQSGTSPGSKRKREDGPIDEAIDGAKRAKSETIMGAAELKRDRENTSIFVRNLPKDITQTKLRQFFREYGHINNIDLQKSEGAPAVALIEFRSPEDARTALLRDGKYLGESVIQVSPATDCTLFVTNYPPEADEQYIRDLFKHCGDIHSIRFPSLKYNTKRRFCYVSFRDRSFAAAATQLDGKPLEGGKYKLQAKFSDPGHKQVRQGAQAEERELHVNNLPRAASEEDVEGLFQKAGNVVSVRLTRNMGGVSTGTAFVVMETKEQAAKAIEILDKVIFGNHPLKVEVSKPPTRKTTATSRADGEAEGSPAESTASGSGSGHVSGPEIAARTIAILGIPDTMNDARVRSIIAPIGTINKLVLHPQHGGAVVEFADAATAGKASLVINSTEIEGGKKLRVGSVHQLFKEKAEKRVDRIDLPHQQPQKKSEDSKASKKGKTAAELMPPPPPIRRPPVLGKAGAKRGLGFVVPVSKAQKEQAAKEGSGPDQQQQQANGTGPSTSSAAGPAAPAPPPVAQKSNADFKKMFLEGRK